jgi:cellulose synthase (UDP-forming)
MIELGDIGPLLMSVGALAALTLIEKNSPRAVRAVASALVILVTARYWWWRTGAIPDNLSLLQESWAWIFFFFESCCLLAQIIGQLFLSRCRERQPPPRVDKELANAPVDVFIPTYNEPIQILERTIVAAKAIEHSDLRVWVLDDGARDWVRDLARDLGAEYVRRVKGKHAKAGNVNNGLEHALRIGRKPEFILLLDADFVAFRNILKRTLGFFSEKDVGIVQTPQHFFNPDPIQSNLLCTRQWPDEQRYFFNTLLSCKDAWDSAFCCGTSAVLRVDALVAAGGMATETVTEDMLTSFKMIEHGYRTIFFNEMLSMGLAPESLGAYVSQRARWCLGAVQQIYTRWSFFGPAKIDFFNRLSMFDGLLYWIGSGPFKVMMIAAPLVYWWTATPVMSCSLRDLLIYLAPSIAASILYMHAFARNRVLPVMSDVTQLLSSFAIMGTVAVGLVKPWGHPFKVTAKGLSSDRVTIQWSLMLPFAVMAQATLVGVIVNTTRYSPLYGADGYDANVFWSIFNIAVLSVACAACVELPKRRSEERFQTDECATLRLANGMKAPCVVRDISLSGAKIALGIGRLRSNDEGYLAFADGVEAPFTLVRNLADGLALRFVETAETRRALIAKLFTGRYNNEVPEIKVASVASAVGRRLAA